MTALNYTAAKLFPAAFSEPQLFRLTKSFLVESPKGKGKKR